MVLSDPNAETSQQSLDAGGKAAGIRSANNVQELYAWVRAAILNGKIGAGEPISQAKLANELGVSRTPLREALRMLQAEGLIVGELNQRMRVATMAAEDIDYLYAARIVLEALGMSLTIPRLTKDETSRIQQTLKHMNAHNWTGDRPAWEVQHNAFHGLLVMHIGTVLGGTMLDTVTNFQLRAERYRRLHVSDDPKASAVAAQDHARIVDAVVAKDTETAVLALATHLARTAKRVLARHAPAFKPAAVDNAMTLVASSTAAKNPLALLLGRHELPLADVQPGGNSTLEP